MSISLTMSPRALISRMVPCSFFFTTAGLRLELISGAYSAQSTCHYL